MIPHKKTKKHSAEEGRRVPLIRFKEFEEDWNNNSVNQLIDKKVLDKPLDGNHGNIHPVSSDFVETGIPFIMANCLRDGGIYLDEAVCIRKEQADNLQKGFSKTGDVLLTHKGSVGLTAIVPELETEYIMLTPQVTYYRVLDEFSLSNVFLKTSFETYSFQKRLKVLADGGTRPYIGITLQRTLKLNLPSLPEQQKIASFLSAVDEKIRQLTKMKALLEQYKKGVMQLLFSQQIRFKDENGNEYPAWEEKRLGEIATKDSSNISANTIEENVGDYKIYGASGLLKKIDFFREEKPFVSIVKDGAGVGRTLLCEANSSVLGTLDIIKPKVKVVLYFLYSVLNNVKFEKYIVGSTIPHIYFKDYSSERITIPVFEEQRKIAAYLSNIDTKIESVNNQITQTQTFKKGLLQQMFV